MAEFTANAIQTVAQNQNILFTEVPVCGNNSIVYRIGSGLVTLRGLTNQCRARFKVSFGGNLAGTASAANSLAIAANGEAIPSTTMTVVPAAADNYFNVYSSVYLDVPAGCCTQVSVKNISANDVNVANSNLIVERVA